MTTIANVEPVSNSSSISTDDSIPLIMQLVTLIVVL